jgi:ribosome-binding protein aMBF1 (putative translation factor)
MTGKYGKIFVIAAEHDGRCEMCSKTAELRPYGKNAANVCFECAMKDEANTKAMFLKRLEGDA